MAHTPGPWHLTGSQQYVMAPNTAGGYSIARMDDLEAPISEREANARLIAAAPQLLEALKRVDHTLSVHGRVDAETPLHEFVSDVIFAAEGARS